MDTHGVNLIPNGSNLSKISSVVIPNEIKEKINNVNWEIVNDVKNVTFGINGCARIYASQKGASENDINYLEQSGLKIHKLLVKLLVKKKKIKTPIIILNIGGIANKTLIGSSYEMSSLDIGPGNCLIDKWIRVNSDKNYDRDGDIARSGRVDKFILEQSLDNFYSNIITVKIKIFYVSCK